MRKLVYTAIGFCIGCGVGAYCFTDGRLLICAGICAIFAVFFLLLKKWKAGILFIGCTLSLLWMFGYSSYFFSQAKEYDGIEIPLRVTITDYGKHTDYGIRGEGKTFIDGKTYRLDIYLQSYLDLQPGDILEGTFDLRLTAPGGSKENTYSQGKGIYYIAYGQEDTEVTGKAGNPACYLPQKMRQGTLSLLDRLFPADVAGFARALLLGDTEKLSYEQSVSFQVSGIRHIVSVSGLHVSILFAFIYTFLGKRKYLTAFLGIPALLFFAAMVGFTPSVTRACIMQIVMILAMLLKREYDPPTALAFAVLVILTVNPFAVSSVSFQLSVSCMVGIFLFNAKILNYFSKYTKGKTLRSYICRFAVSSLSVTVSTMLPTAPLCAWYFGSVSLAALLTNMLTLWLISVIFFGIIAAAVLSLLWFPLGQGFAFVTAFLVRILLFITRVISSFPFAAVYTASGYIVLWLIFSYGLLALFWLRRYKRPLCTAVAIVMTLVLAIVFSVAEPRLDQYRVTVLDVGQGQCVLLQSKGKTYMVDCGGNANKTVAETAAQMLLSQGIHRLDGIILTSYDRGYTGGLSCFLSRISVRTVYMPEYSGAQPVSVDGDKTYFVRKTVVLPCGMGEITMLPCEKGMGVLFRWEECAILITGNLTEDGERKLLDKYSLPKLDVLIAGRRGREDATGLGLLMATRPDTVVISAEEGSPTGKALERMKLFGCRILHTGKQGTIIIRR